MKLRDKKRLHGKEPKINTIKAFTKDMTIGDVADCGKEAQAVLMGFGMHCFGCPMSRMETIEQAAAVHGVDVNFMLEKLNELIK